MTLHSNLAYAQPAAPTRTPRAAEYEVIARITRQLAATAARRTENYPAFIAALADNERLWSTLAVDVAGDGNGLPQALRARLFFLAASAEVLVDINTAVLRGLRGEGGAA